MTLRMNEVIEILNDATHKAARLLTEQWDKENRWPEIAGWFSAPDKKVDPPVEKKDDRS